MQDDGKRASAYGFLRTMFCDLPTNAFVAAVGKHALEAPDEPGSSAIAMFIRDTANAGEKERLRLVAVDRTRLMRGAGAPDVRIPYESVHVGRPAPEVAADLAACYGRASLRVSSEVHESPEYFGVECAFMEQVIREGQVDLARTFFSNHVGSFGMSVAEEVQMQARTGFYKGLAEALEVFLRAEARLFTVENTRASQVLIE